MPGRPPAGAASERPPPCAASSFSPPLTLALILAACGGDGDDQGAATAAPAPAATAVEDDTDTVRLATDEGDLAIGGAESLPEGFPQALVYPGGIVETSFSVGDDRTLVVFSTLDGVDDVLDFYEDAFEAVGLGDDGERIAAGGFGSYSVGDDETGSGVIFEADAAENGDNLVTIGYFAK